MTEERDLQPDPEMDGQVGAWLVETDLSAGETTPGLTELLEEFPVTPQTRRRLWGRWFGRGDGGVRRARDDDERDSGNSGRNRIMFSATGLLGAIVVLALVVNLGGSFDGNDSPSRGAGQTHVVALDGSADHRSITDAVALAEDGDTILVRPGLYLESVEIDKDLTVAGDGDRDQVVIRIPEEGPTAEWFAWDLAYAFHLHDSKAEVRNLTITGPGSSVSAFVVRDGDATIAENVVALDPQVIQSPRGLAYVVGASNVTLNDNVSDGFVWVANGAALMAQRNEHLPVSDTGPSFRIDGAGSTAQVVDNEAMLILVHKGATATAEGNVVGGGTDTSWTVAACRLDIDSAGPGVIVTGNTIVGGGQGICATDTSALTLSHNEVIEASIAGISLSATDALVASNHVSGTGIGVSLQGGTSEMTGNIINATRVGIALLAEDTVVSLSGNRVCATKTAINLSGGAAAPDSSADTTC